MNDQCATCLVSERPLCSGIRLGHDAELSDWYGTSMVSGVECARRRRDEYETELARLRIEEDPLPAGLCPADLVVRCLFNTDGDPAVLDRLSVLSGAGPSLGPAPGSYICSLSLVVYVYKRQRRRRRPLVLESFTTSTSRRRRKARNLPPLICTPPTARKLPATATNLPALIRFPVAVAAAAARDGWSSVELVRHTDTPERIRWSDLLVVSGLDLICQPNWYVSLLAAAVESRQHLGYPTVFTLVGPPPYPPLVHQVFASSVIHIDPELVNRVTTPFEHGPRAVSDLP